MNIKKYLQLSDEKLYDLENKYTYIPSEYEIDTIGLSIDRCCLKETAKIARLRAEQRQSAAQEQRLFEKRREAIRSRFIGLTKMANNNHK